MHLANRIFSVATVVLFVALALFLFLPRQPLIHSVQGTSKTILLVGTVSAWNASTTNPNPTITVTQGDIITVQLSSTDSTHQFALDVDRDGPMFIGACPSGDTCSKTFTPTASTTLTFTASFAAGTYTYFCTFHPAMVGSLIIQAPPTPDFTIASSPSSLSFPQGSSSTSTITLTSINGFSGTINLAATASPVGPSTSFNPVSVTVSMGSSGTSTLTISTASSTPSGVYIVKVNGTSGSTVHTTTVTVQVNAPTGLPVAVVVGAAIAIIAAIGVVVYLVRRKPVAT